MRLQIAGTVPLLFILPFKHIAVFGLVIECTLRKNAVPCSEITRAHQHSPFWQANASSGCRFSPAYLFLFFGASWMYDDSWHFWVKPHYVTMANLPNIYHPTVSCREVSIPKQPLTGVLSLRQSGRPAGFFNHRHPGPNGDSFRGYPENSHETLGFLQASKIVSAVE